MNRLRRLLGLLIVCGCAVTVSDREALRRLGERRGPPCGGVFSIEFDAQDSLPLAPFMSIPAVAVSVAGRQSTLLIDTGSPHNLLAPELVEELDLPVFGRKRLTLLGSEEETFQTCVHELRAGGLVCRHAPFLVSPGHLERSVLGFTLQRADGVLGMAFLEPLAVTIDLRRGEVRFRDERRTAHGPGVHSAPLFLLDDGRPCVAVALDKGPPRLFLLDTGARRCVLAQRTARALGLPALDNVTLLSLGVEVRATTTRIPRLAIGDAVFSDIDAYVLATFEERLGSRIQGIVGIELFNDLAITIDVPREMLVIEGAGTR